MLAKLIREHAPRKVVVAYDSPWPTIRHRRFPEYKANRQDLPKDLLDQVPLVRLILQNAGIFGLALAGYEGDDILASIAQSCKERGERVLLVSGDRDLFQTVSDPYVQLLYTRRGVQSGQIVDETGVQDLVGVRPSRYVDLAALRGDPSDNLPGIRGIGPKTALTLLQSATNLEDLLSGTTTIPARHAQVLLGGKDQVVRNRDLMQLVATIPIPWSDIERVTVPENLSQELTERGLDGLVRLLLAARGDSEDATSSSAAARQPRTKPRGARVGLVVCSSEKQNARTRADDLYTSQRFRFSRAWCEQAMDSWYILSAQHGLVLPSQVLAPYDMDLASLSQERQALWANAVVASLLPRISPGDTIYLIGEGAYTAPIRACLSAQDYRAVTCLDEMSAEQRVRWLEAHVRIRDSIDCEEFYDILGMLAERSQRRRLSDAGGWPRRGVYFFFEPDEFRLYTTVPRVVRVGTHGVSNGSKSSLWNRLRTHRGTDAGGGNHRSSIFRSHVGAAIIEKESLRAAFPHWGDQSADSLENREVEAPLEKRVSHLIDQMVVAYVDIPDAPGPRSDRAYIERNAIALLSRVGSVLDPASAGWLGRSCPNKAVRQSGLWNVNYVDDLAWDRDFLTILHQYALVTIGDAQPPAEPIAPPGWWDRSVAHEQTSFRWDTPPT